MKYACDQRDYQASQQGHLTKHIKIKHDEHIMYDCNQCDKHYADQKHLRRHIQSVHEGVKYACNQCDKEYTDHSGLTTHIKSVHDHEGVKYAYIGGNIRVPGKSFRSLNTTFLFFLLGFGISMGSFKCLQNIKKY